MSLFGNDDHTRKIEFGKYVGVLYPNIYYETVSRLMKYHPDIIEAMRLAQCKLEDGSARDFLNRILQVDVSSDTPMEIGYKVYYAKLLVREQTQLAAMAVRRMAEDQFGHDHQFNYRSEEEANKPLFPSIEEMEDKGIK